MLHLARFSIRHPIPSLAACLAVVVALCLVGLGVSHSTSPSIVVVPGTESSRAESLAESQFGPSVLVPILLEGPARRLDRQGPALVRKLAARPDTRVLSAWDAGATGRELRPRPGAAMIVASVARTEKQMVDTYQQKIDATVHGVVSAPVHASITGQPTLDRAFRSTAIDDTRTGALLTIPILFVVLLLLFRAPLAAAGAALMAGATALAGMGVMALVGKAIDVDAIAMTLGVMTGLALSAGYSVLIFRRWREEVDRDVAHHDAAHAAVTAVATAGRAILIGGTAVVVALVVAAEIAPTKILTSLGIGAMLCATLAIGATVVVLPASLALLGHRALWLSFPAPRPLRRAWDRLVAGGGWVVRHAVVVGAVATAALAALALPLTNLKTGPPSAQMLPADDSARVSFERVAHVMGPGWPTPFNIVVASTTRPITDPALLVQLDRFQTKLAADPRVASVVGPAAFSPVSKQLGSFPKKLKESTKLLTNGKRDLGRLQAGLSLAGAGSAKLQSGLGAAAGGAGQLQSGSGQAQSGAGQLHAGLGKAEAGASQISGGLAQALDAARQLRDGAGQALTGSQQLQAGIGKAATPVKQGLPIVQQMATSVTAGDQAVKSALGSSQAASAQLDQAAAQLQALPSSPEVTAALNSVQAAQSAAASTTATLNDASPKLSGAAVISSAFATQVGQLSTGLAQLYAGSSALTNGISQLQAGNAALAAGIDKLAGGGGQLTNGISALRAGAGQLETGLGQLTSGAGQLAGGLSGGIGPAGQLTGGLGQLEAGVAQFRTTLPSPKDLQRLQKQSPGLFDSGYFVLAAIEGAPPAQRNQATFAVNLTRGGSSGQITVVSRYGAAAPTTQRLGDDLQHEAAAFGAATNTQVAVGGPAGNLGDFTSETKSSIWPVVVGLAVIVSLLLMALLRAIVLPLVAVAFDLLTAAAAFGVVTLLCSGDNPPMGGPGYVDPMSIIATLAAVFGITIIYEVALLQRTREAFVEDGDAHAALRTGLRGTAAAGTGAALAMLAAIVPFIVVGDLLVVRQVGVGVAAAIILDALIVRPVLLPAAAEVLGRAAWWPTSPRRAVAQTRPQPPAAPPLPGGPIAGTKA